MSEPTEQDPPPYRVPTHWELAMVQLGADSFKQSMPLLNDLLAKLIVLNTALLGIFTGLKDLPMPLSFRVLAIVCFAISLVLSFWGVYPKDAKVDPTDPKQIESSYTEGVKRKSSYLKSAAIALIVGFAVALVGLVYGAITTPETQPIPMAAP